MPNAKRAAGCLSSRRSAGDRELGERDREEWERWDEDLELEPRDPLKTKARPRVAKSPSAKNIHLSPRLPGKATLGASERSSKPTNVGGGGQILCMAWLDLLDSRASSLYQRPHLQWRHFDAMKIAWIAATPDKSCTQQGQSVQSESLPTVPQYLRIDSQVCNMQVLTPAMQATCTTGRIQYTSSWQM